MPTSRKALWCESSTYSARWTGGLQFPDWAGYVQPGLGNLEQKTGVRSLRSHSTSARARPSRADAVQLHGNITNDELFRALFIGREALACGLASTIYSVCRHAKWQYTSRPSSCFIGSGRFWAQISWASGQRLRNLQP